MSRSQCPPRYYLLRVPIASKITGFFSGSWEEPGVSLELVRVPGSRREGIGGLLQFFSPGERVSVGASNFFSRREGIDGRLQFFSVSGGPSPPASSLPLGMQARVGFPA